MVTGERSVDVRTASGALVNVIAKRSRPKPVIPVAGRCALPKQDWSAAGLDAVMTVSEVAGRPTVDDPELTARFLAVIGRRVADFARVGGCYPLDGDSAAGEPLT